MAIIANLDELGAAPLYIYINALGTGIEAVFNQLLQYRSRAFDHLPSSNLIS